MGRLKVAVLAALALSSNVAAQTKPAAPDKRVNPDWLKKPDPSQMRAVYPADAHGADGSALIRCIVMTNGLLRACKVLHETPEGKGFGGAAILLSSSFLMKPATKNGVPIKGDVTIPINWKGFGGYGASSGPTVEVMNTAAWAQTPTMPDILAELDKKVGDKFADGKVVFQCTVNKKTGRLANCQITNVSASMTGFTSAARSLTSKFQVRPDSVKDIKNETRVNLAFSFPDMQSDAWSKRYLAHPVWLQTISPDPDKGVFPEEAIKAGLKQGSATEDCVLSATGALTQCQTISESVPNVGFGTMAKQIAEVFVANPWTEDGLPADGAHVRFPITMKYDPALDKAAPDSAATKH